MRTKFNFDDLFVFDVANNHQGSVEHGLSVVRGVGEVARKHGVRGGIKFQFRQLDTFLHPDFLEDTNNKHIPRFLSTRLNREQYQILLDESSSQGMVSICTPFDEESVDIIVEMGFDILKVASCSAKDWPLLEAIAAAGKPIIFSTGGLTIEDIDNVVSFLGHRGSEFAIMHCVSIYPIPAENFQLNQIDTLRLRYPDTTIGWSTHENPTDNVPIAMAIAKGARMYERHVGVETDKIKLNAYSSTPAQLDAWLAAHRQAIIYCGASKRPPAPTVELESLDSLRRGVYAKVPLAPGDTLTRDKIFFAMPYQDGQLESGHWNTNIVVNTDTEPGMKILKSTLAIPEQPDYLVIKKAVHEVKAMLNEAKIALNSDFEVEYSHHYGIPKFRETGAVIINCVNREYCKKLIVQLPGQYHPTHFHALKEETFQVLHGTLHAEVDGHVHVLLPGETLLVQPGVWHSFWSESGTIFEEVSTTHHNGDSTYRDPAINVMKRHERKTIVDHWGRDQLQYVRDQ